MVFTASSLAASVLMISIDGLKPEYVTHADEHGLKIPTLRRFMKEGAYADGVIAVLPTVTYPDHTTLITGVWPAEHGILNNGLFDPERKMTSPWYWYAESIKVPTLWDAAHQAKIGTASVSWPVSVNATSVDTLIPEYWRISPSDTANPQDRYLINALSRPDGMLAEMQKRIGPYMNGSDTTVEGDATRTRFSLDIIRNRKPGFMTIHLSAMDASEHETGPFTPGANKTLEAVDGMVAQLIDAMLANDPQAKVVIVSDHGFLNVEKNVNLYIPFVQAGLIQVDEKTKAIKGWKAQIWSSGGLGAVMLHDPADTTTKQQVKELLTRMAADPGDGIDQILEADKIRERGGFPDATYLIVMKQGFSIGSALSGPMFSDPGDHKGNHGFWPLFPEMHSSFFVMGQGVAKGRDLGMIDMRQIAPTVAQILGVTLPTAKEPKLHIEP